MNGNSPLSFLDWLVAHVTEVAMWSAGAVLVLVLLVVFGPGARAWRNPAAPAAEHEEAEDVASQASVAD